MSKKDRSRDWIKPAEEPEAEPIPTMSFADESLQEVYRCAKAMNGIDHMRLCAYYVVNSDHCDCGLEHLRLAVAQYEVALGQLNTTEHQASGQSPRPIA